MYFLNEMIGTFLLVLLGDGVCCNVKLDGSGMKGGDTTHIALGWGLAVAANGTLDWALVPQYIVGQMLGGFLGAAFLIVLFHDQLKRTEDSVLKRGCFCTAPGIRNYWRNALSEITCSFVLVFAILGIGSTTAGVSAVNYLFVYAIIVSIGMSFGGLTGYSMNAPHSSQKELPSGMAAPQ